MKIQTRVLWIGIAGALGMYGARTLWLGWAGLTYPYQLDYGEGIVLWFAQQLARGETIYKGLEGLPYASSNYPPLAMLLSAALMPLFGDGYAGGRLLNFAAALIVAALIYAIVRVETGARRAGLVAALFFLAAPYIYHWVPLFRADLLGLGFAFAGVYFVWRWERAETANSRFHPGIYFFLFTCCFLLALYTKHTLFAAPVAAFFALALRDKRRALGFAVALGASGGAIYLALDWLTRGGFTFGLIESNATVFLLEQLIALLTNFALTFPILIALAAWRWGARVRAKKIGVLEIYAVLSFAALAMAGRVGAWENYFFEAIAILCVLAFGNLPRGFRDPVYALLLLLQLGLFWRDPRIAADLIARELPANRELETLLRRTPGMILAEDMGALATSDKDVVYYTFQYSSLARSGKWDQSWELNGLRAGIFPLVVLEQGTREDVDHYRRFTREFVSNLDRYYARTQRIGKYEIYTPAPLAHLQPAVFGDTLALVGWSAQPATLNAATLNLTVVWQAQRQPDRRYTAFAHLETGGALRVAQDDHEPRAGAYPTTRWAAHEMVRDMFTLNLPSDLAPGKYVVRLGWYDADTGDRLAVPGSADDAWILAAFER